MPNCWPTAARPCRPAQVRQKLAVVAEESARLSKMVANLLDASRIQAGGLELKPEPVDIPPPGAPGGAENGSR